MAKSKDRGEVTAYVPMWLKQAIAIRSQREPEWRSQSHLIEALLTREMQAWAKTQEPPLPTSDQELGN